MQCKDIPNKPILAWLEARRKSNALWATWYPGYENSVPMPDGTPEKVIYAKMATLIRRGLVSGCDCGCRGDYEITEKGRAFLAGQGTSEGGA